MLNFAMEPMPHDEAAELIADKPVVTKEVFERLPAELQARAFTITGIEDFDVLAAVRDRIAELPEGADWEEVKQDVISEISPWFNEVAAEKRAELLMRHHAFTAYAAAQAREMDELMDVFPYRQYISTEDSRVRPSHAALNGIVLPADHKFWANHTPPWEWNCRCDVVELTAEDAEDERKRDRGRAAEAQRVLSGPALKQLENESRLVRGVGVNVDLRTPKQKGGNFEINVRDLNMNYDEIQKRWDSETRKEFEAWASDVDVEDGVSLMSWLSGAVDVAKKINPLKKSKKNIEFTESVSELATRIVKLDDKVQRAKKKLVSTLDTTKGLEESERLLTKIDGHVEEARALLSLPENARGKVKLKTQYSRSGKKVKTSRAIVKRAENGAKIVERYVHPDLLPEITVKGNRKVRAYHVGSERAIYISSNESLSTIAHEVLHAVEQQNKLNVDARKFLLKRADGQSAKKLRALTGMNYEAHEVSYEDDWLKNGGDHYMGKDYGARGTELLSMGIERLDADPIEFAKNDREYFEFFVKLIQKR